MFAWLAVGRISTLVLKPRASAARATAAPTKPEAPVTSTVSLMAGHFPPGRPPKPAALLGFARPRDRFMRFAHHFSPKSFAAFEALPIKKRRHAQHDLPRPLQQRY